MPTTRTRQTHHQERTDLFTPKSPAIGLILNPRAGSYARFSKDLEDFKRLVYPRGLVVTSEHPEQLPKIFADFRERGISLVAFAGGDGTLQHGLDHMLSFYNLIGEPLPPILQLGGGTMNAVFRDVKGHGQPLETLAGVVTSIRRGEPLVYMERETIQCGSRHGFIMGMGFLANANDFVESRGKKGQKAVAPLIMRVISGTFQRDPEIMKLFTSIRAKVVCDGVTLDSEEFTLLLFSTIKSTGTSMVITPLAGERRGYFNSVALLVHQRDILANLRPVFKGHQLIGEKSYCLQSSQATVTPIEPMTAVMDGESFLLDKEVTISTGPLVTFARSMQSRVSWPMRFRRPQ